MSEHKQQSEDVPKWEHWGICPGCKNHLRFFKDGKCTECGWELTHLGR